MFGTTEENGYDFEQGLEQRRRCHNIFRPDDTPAGFSCCCGERTQTILNSAASHSTRLAFQVALQGLSLPNRPARGVTCNEVRQR